MQAGIIIVWGLDVCHFLHDVVPLLGRFSIELKP
jgi:hypothetical protein